MDKTWGSKQYTERAYWDSRFQREEKYEWLATWADIADLVAIYIPAENRARTRVLLLGNGTSRCPLDMAGAGYRNIVATDYSAVCVQRMQELCAGQPGADQVTWAVSDMTDLALTGAPAEHGDGNGPVRFAPGSFDLILDKAAMDAILADGGDVWDAPPSLLEQARLVVDGVHSLLDQGGVFVQLSFSQPHFRRQYLVPALHARPVYMHSTVSVPAVDDEGEEWEPDTQQHLTPTKYRHGAVGLGKKATGEGPETSQDCQWASPGLVVHPIPVGLGYFLYFLKKA